MIIEIEALDTLFFRDGKPFSMGEEVWADGVFPPSPSVIYGALRSAYFANNSNELDRANESDDPTSNLEITSIYYRFKNANYLPLPLDLVQIKSRSKGKKESEQTYKLISLACSQDKGFYSSLDMPAILRYDKEVEAIEDGIIEWSDFGAYITGHTKDLECKKFGDLIKREPKIGIGRENSTHSADEGKIYRVGMQRLNGLTIVVEFEGLEIDKEGFLKFGGEGKAIFYKQLDEVCMGNPKITGNIFKLYLSTPAIFKNGWIPGWLKEDTSKDGIKSFGGIYKGVTLKLLTAAIGKYTSIGGFDMKAGKPKPMRKAVPAGSVYYFEFEDCDGEKIIEIFNKKSISDFNRKEGFGIGFVGGVKC